MQIQLNYVDREEGRRILEDWLHHEIGNNDPLQDKKYTPKDALYFKALQNSAEKFRVFDLEGKSSDNIKLPEER